MQESLLSQMRYLNLLLNTLIQKTEKKASRKLNWLLFCSAHVLHKNLENLFRFDKTAP